VEVSDKRGEGFAQWTLLYVTGLLLIVFVVVHVGAVHYGADGAAEGFSFADVTERMESPSYRFILLGLLVVASLHGLVGVHRFIADLGLCGRLALRTVGVVLSAAGVAGLVYGWLVYRAFAG